MKIILDTDIGTDVDDILALNLLLNSPEAELLGITTAYGDTRLRAKVVYQVLAAVGRAGQIPIAAGARSPLNENRKIFWAGHEGKHLDGAIPDDIVLDTSAEDFLLETVGQHPGEVTIIAIAPLGNLARAILKSPQTMQQVKQIYIMGGSFDLKNFDFPPAEHNIASDPEAAQIVFESGLPIVLFPLDVTTKTFFGQAEVARLRGSDQPLAQLLRAEVETWLQFVKDRFGREFTHMHDPLTAAALLNPKIAVKSKRIRLDVELQGSLTTGITIANTRHEQPNVEVVLEIDGAEFHDFFLQRLT